MIFAKTGMPFNEIASHTIEAQVQMYKVIIDQSDNGDGTKTFASDADYHAWLNKD